MTIIQLLEPRAGSILILSKESGDHLVVEPCRVADEDGGSYRPLRAVKRKISNFRGVRTEVKRTQCIYCCPLVRYPS